MERALTDSIYSRILILFKNIENQIKDCNIDFVLDGVSNSRWIFHMRHSLDKFFINPKDYEYLADFALGCPKFTRDMV
ncbi:MAG: hypothetical protein GX297_01580 [Treponema sp.]|jgi:hypothetical protein|nr:hypothetical protein [Treponema sp.]